MLHLLNSDYVPGIVPGTFTFGSVGTMMDLHICVPPNSYVEIQIPIVMVSGGGVSGRTLGDRKGALMNGISAFLKGPLERFLAPSTM